LTEQVNDDGPTLGLIRKARALHEAYGGRLMADEHVRALVQGYGAAIEQTAAAMQGEGIGAACSVCAQQNPSGCCFSGLESGFNEIMLLLNLLLGCPLPEARALRDTCFFVGEQGCQLLARYYFCLHYFCPALEASLGEARIGALQQRVGRELQAGWVAEDAVRRWLGSRSTAATENESS
jgi:hypothetical protein